MTLTPSFIWDGITGISQYEISISHSDDPTIQDPFFTEDVSGTFFQYSQYANNPLEAGELYYWKIVPIDAIDNRGLSSAYFSFSTTSETNADLDRPEDTDSDEDWDTDSDDET